MDTRYTPEQVELQRTARQLTRELGPRMVADLDDDERRARLAEAVRKAGWLELRQAADEGEPLASGVEAAGIAEVLGESVADVPFTGPTLAADLARRAGASPVEGTVVAFSSDLGGPAVASAATTSTPTYAVDGPASGPVSAYVLVPEADGYRLGLVASDAASNGTDLTRCVRPIADGASLAAVSEQSRLLTAGDLEAWTALGLALTSADLVGLMRGAIDVTVAYAKERKQYGVAIGSFQAIHHLLADAHTLMEGAFSAAQYAAWAADELEPGAACTAGRVAKAYCARAARTVCETAIQVHGGMGNTWDCIVHVYLRRALLSSQWFGDDGQQLHELARTRLGVPDGLS
jgi:alkylation response protein AidB-like acyl-CoA dehydrogenase